MFPRQKNWLKRLFVHLKNNPLLLAILLTTIFVSNHILILYASLINLYGYAALFNF